MTRESFYNLPKLDPADLQHLSKPELFVRGTARIIYWKICDCRGQRATDHQKLLPACV